MVDEVLDDVAAVVLVADAALDDEVGAVDAVVLLEVWAPTPGATATAHDTSAIDVASSAVRVRPMRPVSLTGAASVARPKTHPPDGDFVRYEAGP